MRFKANLTTLDKKIPIIFLFTFFSFLIATIFIHSQILSSRAEALNLESQKLTPKIKSYHRANLAYFETASRSALRKSQGVEVATVEAKIEEIRTQILQGSFDRTVVDLNNLSQVLDLLYSQKVAVDKAASEAARLKAIADKKKADEEAQRKAALAIPQTPTVKTDPNSLGFGYQRINLSTKNGTFTVNLIKINLSTARVITDTANDNDCANACPTMPLADYINRNSASFGINGTYFCPPDYASCSGKTSSYDFPVYNSRLNKWLNQGNLYWDNRAMITFNSGNASFYATAKAAPTSGFQASIVSSPGLLEYGQDIVGRYSLTQVQTTKGARGGLGIKGSTLFMVIASGASVPDLAAVFSALGADHALNIDGGGSSALWAGGYRVGPGRLLPNALVIVGGQ